MSLHCTCTLQNLANLRCWLAELGPARCQVLLDLGPGRFKLGLALSPAPWLTLVASLRHHQAVIACPHGRFNNKVSTRGLAVTTSLCFNRCTRSCHPFQLLRWHRSGRCWPCPPTSPGSKTKTNRASRSMTNQSPPKMPMKTWKGGPGHPGIDRPPLSQPEPPGVAASCPPTGPAASPAPRAARAGRHPTRQLRSAALRAWASGRPAQPWTPGWTCGPRQNRGAQPRCACTSGHR